MACSVCQLLGKQGEEGAGASKPFSAGTSGTSLGGNRETLLLLCLQSLGKASARFFFGLLPDLTMGAFPDLG